jgi:hypothetical protein
LQIITQTYPAKPWRPSETQDQARRRGTSSSSQEEKDKLKPGASQEVKDKLAAKPGGVGKTEASQHQQQTKLYTAPLLHNYRQKVENLQVHH